MFSERLSEKKKKKCSIKQWRRIPHVCHPLASTGLGTCMYVWLQTHMHASNRKQGREAERQGGREGGGRGKDDREGTNLTGHSILLFGPK